MSALDGLNIIGQIFATFVFFFFCMFIYFRFIGPFQFEGAVWTSWIDVCASLFQSINIVAKNSIRTGTIRMWLLTQRTIDHLTQEKEEKRRLAAYFNSSDGNVVALFVYFV